MAHASMQTNAKEESHFLRRLHHLCNMLLVCMPCQYYWTISHFLHV